MQQVMSNVIGEMREIGEHLLHWRTTENLRSYSYKQGKEVVSELDRRAERLVRTVVHRYLPEYKIWGEELGRDTGDLRTEKFVLIDAIDGSKNYLSGNPLFASQIAVFDGGNCIWSIVNLPALEEIYYAEMGRGAFCGNNPLRISTQTDLGLALQCFGIGHDAKNFLTLPRLIKDHLAEPRHYGCAGVHWSFLACGRTDIYIVAESKYYDAAPGILLAREAGIEFCTLDGSEYREHENGLSLVAANPALIADYKKKRVSA